jgi:hypothetical protein
MNVGGVFGGPAAGGAASGATIGCHSVLRRRTGLIQTNVQGAVELFDGSESLFGLSVGTTGAYGFVTETLGFRGDVQWYYYITDPELEGDLLDIGLPLDIDRDFGRATGGVTLRW